MGSEVQAASAAETSAIRWRAAVAIGIATGVFSGLLGIGGAAILIPGLVEVMGVSQHRAHATSLLVMIPAAALSAVVYALNQPLAWGSVLILSAASMVGATIGARLMAHLPAATLKRLFGLFLLVVAIRMLLPEGAGESAGADRGVATAEALPIVGGILLGLVAGIGSGLLGIGGGQILIPGMTMLLGTPQRVAQGISLAFIVPTALAGVLTHQRKGNLAARAAVPIIPGALIGGVVGSALAQLLDGATLRQIFAIFLLYMSVRMIAPSFYARAQQGVKDAVRGAIRSLLAREG